MLIVLRSSGRARDGDGLYVCGDGGGGSGEVDFTAAVEAVV